MAPLENWIEELLQRPLDEVNEEYETNGQVAQEVLDLCGFDPREYRACWGGVAADILVALHQRLRGHSCEWVVWDAVLFYVGELPPAVAHDLLDRDVVVSQLGHTRQSDEVQWRLAGLVEEALVTLVWDLFTKPQYTASELEKLLNESPKRLELLDKWEHWVLYGLEVRDLEKELVFHRWVWEHRDGFLWRRHPLSVPDQEQFLELLAQKERKNLERRLRQEREAEEERARRERETQRQRAEFERIEGSALDEAEMERILNEKDPLALLALAGNGVIERKWVERLVNCYGVKGARAIREAAGRNLEGRF